MIKKMINMTYKVNPMDYESA